MSRFVAIETDDGVLIHAEPGTGNNYGSLCGISIDDDEENGREVPLPIGAKIDCRDCINIIRTAKRFRERDFADNMRK